MGCNVSRASGNWLRAWSQCIICCRRSNPQCRDSHYWWLLRSQSLQHPSPWRPGGQGPSGCALSGSVGRDCSQEPRLPGIPFKELASLCPILVCNYLDDWHLSASSEDSLLTTFVEFLFSKRIFFNHSQNSFSLFLNGRRTPQWEVMQSMGLEQCSSLESTNATSPKCMDPWARSIADIETETRMQRVCSRASDQSRVGAEN